MNLLIVDNYKNLSEKAADIIVNQVNLNPNSILGLATGSTPLGMYKEIIAHFNNFNVDFSNVKTFNLDEYYGLDKKNTQSYHYYMIDNFFKHINIKSNNIHILNGQTEDVEKECIKYEKKIKDLGGIDLQVLGIGVNGHVGFNEPNNFFEPNTHLVCLDEKTICSNSRFFNTKDEVPTKAISMGIKTIMSCKKILLIASGDSKADAIKESIHGKITPYLPGSILQLHPNVTFVIDKAAASKL